jgi:TatD DNase family protein
LADGGSLDTAYAEIETLATHPRVRVVGETGLDYFRTGPEGVEAQQDSFRWHIDLAKRLGRSCRSTTVTVMTMSSGSSTRGAPNAVVMHCFSGM